MSLLAEFKNGQNALNDDPLRDHRLEFVVDEINGVDLLVKVAGSNVVGQLPDAVVIHLVEQSGVVADDLDTTGTLPLRAAIFPGVAVLIVELRDRITPPEEVAPFAADGFNVDLPGVVVIDELQRRLDDVRVKGPGKTLIAGDDNYQHPLLFASLEAGMDELAGCGVVKINAPLQRLQHAGQHRHVRARVDRPLLSATQLGGRDHLHGLGDLARALDAANAPP